MSTSLALLGHAQSAAGDRHHRSGVLCPVASGPMGDEDALNIAVRLKALADPARSRSSPTCSVRRPARRSRAGWPTVLGLTDPPSATTCTNFARPAWVLSRRRGVNVFHRVRPDALQALAPHWIPTAAVGSAGSGPTCALLAGEKRRDIAAGLDAVHQQVADMNSIPPKTATSRGAIPLALKWCRRHPQAGQQEKRHEVEVELAGPPHLQPCRRRRATGWRHGWQSSPRCSRRWR